MTGLITKSFFQVFWRRMHCMRNGMNCHKDTWSISRTSSATRQTVRSSYGRKTSAWRKTNCPTTYWLRCKKLIRNEIKKYWTNAKKSGTRDKKSFWITIKTTKRWIILCWCLKTSSAWRKIRLKGSLKKSCRRRSKGNSMRCWRDRRSERGSSTGLWRIRSVKSKRSRLSTSRNRAKSLASKTRPSRSKVPSRKPSMPSY